MKLEPPSVLLGINPWLDRHALRFQLDLGDLAPRLAKNNPKRKAFRTLPELIPALRGYAAFDAFTREAKGGKFTPDQVVKMVLLAVEAIQASLQFRECHVEAHRTASDHVVELIASSHEIELTNKIVSFAILATLGSLGNDVVEQLPAPNLLAKQVENTWLQIERAAQQDGLPAQHRFLIAEARRRGIRWQRVLRRPALLHFGSGARWRRLELTTTDRTGYLAATTAARKPRAAAMMQMMSVPVPAQLQVQQADQAVAAAEKIGYPVVTKPLSGNRGRGVSANLKSAQDVRQGFQRAAAVNKTVLVEDFLEGEDYRLLIVNGRCVAAVKRVPPSVVGDGKRTVRKLIEHANKNRMRPDGLPRTLAPLPMDAEAERVMSRKGWSLDAMPPEGERVYLRSVANGGTTEDVTHKVHPDNVMACVRAAQILGVDVAGADFISPDISKSYREVGGGLNECNYKPDLFVHILAEHEPDQPLPDVVGALFDFLFPPAEPLGTPTVVVLGGGADSLRDGISAMRAALSETGRVVGGLGPDGVFSALGHVEPFQHFALQSPKVFLDTGVDAIVFAADARQACKDGLGAEYLDVLVLTADCPLEGAAA